MKRIGIMTTGGDCSGLNSVIYRVIQGAHMRGWDVVGIIDGTDGLYSGKSMNIDFNVLPLENARLSGSVLYNSGNSEMNYERAAKDGVLTQFCDTLKSNLDKLNLDGLIVVGGNGSASLIWNSKIVYSDLSVVCIPKTIDLDMPLTDKTIGFDTAVQQLTVFCDQLLLTARSHHRWFVVQVMGRDCGALTLNAGIASGADVILIPEIKFDTNDMISHIKSLPRDYGIIMVSEGITLRGHSGKPADMISRQLTGAGILNRTSFPDHIQRSGDSSHNDRILAAKMANCALEALENKETYVITALDGEICKTVSISDFINAGDLVPDPHIPNMFTSNAYVEPDNPLVKLAIDMGVYIGSVK